MKKLFLLPLLLAACAEPQPNIATQQLLSACEAGNLEACVAYEELRQQNVRDANAVILGGGLIQPYQLPSPAPMTLP